jgi:tetratricopeptide (TPR) repeat protein
MLSCLSRTFQSRPLSAASAVALLVFGLALAPAALAQSAAASSTAQSASAVPADSPSSSSSSSSSTPESQAPDTTPAARIAQPNAGGSAITLETSEPLFYLATALNACGYDTGLAESNPVRLKVRDEINAELAASAPARDARDSLCTFIREHALADPGHNVAQYVSLALYLTPPPSLTLSADMTELPPDSTQVVEILSPLRAFADAVHLNALWFQHRPEYDGLVDRIHDPLTRMILDTNIYLHLPVSSYDGRRFVVLLEPMLAPTETNARYNGTDSVVVVSPRADPPDAVPMDLVRHTYLHFLVEPMVNSRTAAMDRLLPLLRSVQYAPLEFTYKSDIVSLLTECLIKAVEAQTIDVGIPRPVKPGSGKDRVDQARYDAEMSAYDHQAEAIRRNKVDLDMHQGWVLVDYFYNQLGLMQKDGSSLTDSIGPMIYGMDVDSERHRDQKIVFLSEGSGGDILRRTPRPLTGLDLAERKLMQGDADAASQLAQAALKTDPANAEVHSLLGRIDLMQGDPEGALDQFTQVVKLSHDPRTLAWAHIYLGRMYDIARDPDDPGAIKPQRDKALVEYRAALANRDSQPDTKAAAERGIQQPFTLPRRTATSSDQQDAAPTNSKSLDPKPLDPRSLDPDSLDSEPLDPTGKAEKQAYRPSPSQ